MKYKLTLAPREQGAEAQDHGTKAGEKSDHWVLPKEGDKNAFYPSTSLSIPLLLPGQGSTTRKNEVGEVINPQRNTFLLSLTKSSHASAMQEGDIP